MLFVRLFALAPLLHENKGLFTQGRRYFTTCFVPALGLNLSPRGMIALHGGLSGLCTTLLVRPSLWALYPLLLLALSLLIASYSLRLSNHLVAAWFMGLLLCLDLLFQTPERRGLAPTPFFLWRHLLWRAAWRPLRLARYVRIETIEGLPELTEEGWGMYWRRLWSAWGQPDLWQYSDYFFHEGLRLLCRTAQPPVIRVVYVEGGRRHETQDYAREAAARPPRYLRLGLFPYTLPLDPVVRHCD